MAAKEMLPVEQDLVELAFTLGERFIHRWDMYARQLKDGRYASIKRPLQRNHLLAHLRGTLTLGAYVLDESSRTNCLVVDADDDPDWRRVTGLARVLDDMGCVSYLEHSRRGGHLWLFFAEPLAGQEVRRFGQGLLTHFGIEGIELFPKQDKLSTGPGSLIRLPFGIHQKSGRRYGFYTAAGCPLAPTLREQIMLLRDPETVPAPVFEQFLQTATMQTAKTPLAVTTMRQNRILDTANAGDALSTKIKAAIRVRDFVLRYVELSPKGLGQCPFHDDNVASFSVNDEHNFWHCFACGTGGSVIDFWMQRQNCDFVTAVHELREMVLADKQLSEPAPVGVGGWGVASV